MRTHISVPLMIRVAGKLALIAVIRCTTLQVIGRTYPDQR